MKLSYRGIPYQPTTLTVEATETEQTAQFLGKSYKVLQGNVAHRHGSTQLRYRGIVYNA